MSDLRKAAEAVLERWDSPAWEWKKQGPTADLMADLRKALAAPKQEPEPVAVVGTQADAWKLVSSKWVPPGAPFKAAHMLRDLPVGTPLYAAPPEDIEALRRDAERYQLLLHWLRHHGLLSLETTRIDTPESYGDWFVLRKPYKIDGSSLLGYGKTEDAAIDAAMGEKR